MHCYLVYYDGGPASAAALRSALDLMEPETRIIALASIVSSAHPPTKDSASRFETGAQAALAGAVANAAERGIAIQTAMLTSADPGRAIVSYAYECHATKIFWGINRAEVERGLNATVQYLLRFAPTQVVLVGL
ncbi:MAG: universal stress protein [Anaerolineae bacterium]